MRHDLETLADRYVSTVCDRVDASMRMAGRAFECTPEQVTLSNLTALASSLGVDAADWFPVMAEVA